jgi:Skp family chaperone for outer membrane proteins
MRGPEVLLEQQQAQAEAFAVDTVAIDLIPQSSQQAPPSPQVNQDLETEIEDYDDQQQGSEEENEATIAEELAYLQQENERLRLEEENMTRRRVTSHQAQVMQ